MRSALDPKDLQLPVSLDYRPAEPALQCGTTVVLATPRPTRVEEALISSTCRITGKPRNPVTPAMAHYSPSCVSQ